MRKHILLQFLRKLVVEWCEEKVDKDSDETELYESQKEKTDTHRKAPQPHKRHRKKWEKDYSTRIEGNHFPFKVNDKHDRPGHRTEDNRGRCKYCNGKHHTCAKLVLFTCVLRVMKLHATAMQISTQKKPFLKLTQSTLSSSKLQLTLTHMLLQTILSCFL